MWVFAWIGWTGADWSGLDCVLGWRERKGTYRAGSRYVVIYGRGGVRDRMRQWKIVKWIHTCVCAVYYASNLIYTRLTLYSQQSSYKTPSRRYSRQSIHLSFLLSPCTLLFSPSITLLPTSVFLPLLFSTPSSFFSSGIP